MTTSIADGILGCDVMWPREAQIAMAFWDLGERGPNSDGILGFGHFGMSCDVRCEHAQIEMAFWNFGILECDVRCVPYLDGATSIRTIQDMIIAKIGKERRQRIIVCIDRKSKCNLYRCFVVLFWIEFILHHLLVRMYEKK
eukprot:847142_1